MENFKERWKIDPIFRSLILASIICVLSPIVIILYFYFAPVDVIIGDTIQKNIENAGKISYKDEIIIVLVGIGTAFIGGKIISNAIEKEDHCTETTWAKIIEITEEPTSNNTTIKFPVYEYEVDGKNYIHMSTTGSSEINYKVGDNVKIYYNPRKPRMFYVEGDVIQTSFATGIIFIIIAILLVLYGMILIVMK